MIITASPFDTIAGLPLHPLVVHFTVVLLPLAAIALAVMVFVPRMAKRYATVAIGAFVVGLGAAVLSLLSGDALAQRVGEPGDHSMWASALTAVAVVALVAILVWYWLNRATERAAEKAGASAKAATGPTAGTTAEAKGAAADKPATDAKAAPAKTAADDTAAKHHAKMVVRNSQLQLLRMAVAALCVVVLVLAVLVGHTGAQAAWGDVVTPPASDSAPTDTATPTEAASPTADAAAAATETPAAQYTLADVAQHATQASCWSAIDGNVYDLTDWIARHPGGPAAIEHICGTDGSSAFDGQHKGQARPDQDLSNYLLGPLSG